MKTSWRVGLVRVQLCCAVAVTRLFSYVGASYRGKSWSGIIRLDDSGSSPSKDVYMCEFDGGELTKVSFLRRHMLAYYHHYKDSFVFNNRYRGKRTGRGV